MDSREQRIATLATTLRSSGIAKSDSQAKMMAEDMIGVEEHVQRDYEVEHTRAHEYLSTTKNLGVSRPVVKPESKVDVLQESPKQVSSKQESKPEPSRFEELYTSGNLTGTKKASAQTTDHDTHNSALESIKAQISQTSNSSVSESVNDSKESLSHEDFVPVDDIISKPVRTNASDDNVADNSTVADILEAPEAPKSSNVEATVEIVPVENPVKEKIEEEPAAESKLDAKRLLDMMEEDGKLEEHTREIKEKPKDVKPKEAYEENNVDLGSMFDFNKGTVRK